MAKTHTTTTESMANIWRPQGIRLYTKTRTASYSQYRRVHETQIGHSEQRLNILSSPHTSGWHNGNTCHYAPGRDTIGYVKPRHHRWTRYICIQSDSNHRVQTTKNPEISVHTTYKSGFHVIHTTTWTMGDGATTTYTTDPWHIHYLLKDESPIPCSRRRISKTHDTRSLWLCSTTISYVS